MDNISGTPLTESMVHQINRLDELKKHLDKYRPLSEADVAALEQDKRIEHVWSSNAIEGSTLTKFETRSIISAGVTVNKASVKDTLAAIDLNDAYDYMMDLAATKQPLTETIIRDLNRIATTGEARTTNKGINPGVYRVSGAYPSGYEEFPYVEPFDIEPQMADLISWSKVAQRKEHPVIYAADLHRRFVSIHPFTDGNGRTARLLMNFALTQDGFPVINVQPDGPHRTEYMEALHHARTTDDENPFRQLVMRYVDKELHDRERVLKLNEKNHQDAERQISPQMRRKLKQQQNRDLER